MNVGDLQDVIERMRQLEKEGYTVVTWNGMGFDFPVLAQESGLQEVVEAMALRHVDMMFHLYCVKGYPLSLKAASTGTGFAQKTADVNGKMAVEMWANGQRDAVLSYCGQDAFATLDLARIADERGRLDWVSRSGRNNRLELPKGWLSARDAMALPLPDTSWMTDPIPREHFTDWLKIQ